MSWRNGSTKWPRGRRPFSRGPAATNRPLVVQRLVDQGNRDRALADGRCHAFDIAGPHVADREDARQARFEEVWRARERAPAPPPGGRGENPLRLYENPSLAGGAPPPPPRHRGRARHPKKTSALLAPP